MGVSLDKITHVKRKCIFPDPPEILPRSTWDPPEILLWSSWDTLKILLRSSQDPPSRGSVEYCRRIQICGGLWEDQRWIQKTGGGESAPLYNSPRACSPDPPWIISWSSFDPPEEDLRRIWVPENTDPYITAPKGYSNVVHLCTLSFFFMFQGLNALFSGGRDSCNGGLLWVGLSVCGFRKGCA